MKLERKRALHLAVLGVLVVAGVGYVSFKFIAPKQQTQRADVKAKAAESQTETRAGPEATVTPEPQPVGLFPDLASLPARRDPFVAQKLPAGEIIGSTVRPPKYTPKLLSNLRDSMARVPPINLKPLNPFSGQSNASVQRVSQDKPEPDDEIAVTGVVRGDSNVVIVRIGQTGRHVVREGQTIDGRYHVASVTGDGAVLVYKNRHIPVKLGGVKNAK